MRSKPATSSTASTSRIVILSVRDRLTSKVDGPPVHFVAPSCPFNCPLRIGACTNPLLTVLYHQPEKMMKSKEDLEARRESLAQLKKQHGID